MGIIPAGIAGGIAMFTWSFCSHTVLPLGGVGWLYAETQYEFTAEPDLAH